MDFFSVIFIFPYCSPFRGNLWADTFIPSMPSCKIDPQLAAEKLKDSFGVAESNSGQSLHSQFVGNDVFVAPVMRLLAFSGFMVLGVLAVQ